MALFRNAIPILEYDDNPAALIRPERHPEIVLPSRAVFAFLGDAIDRYAQTHEAQVLDVFQTVTGDTPIYRIDHQGQALCLCRAPLGASASVQLLDWLIGHGVRSVICAGSCGALVPLPENTFLIPAKALRDDGTSYHYLPPARFVEIPVAIRNIIERVLSARGLKYTECITWTTDGFYRETEELVAYRRTEGCSTVEMECAALAACAQFRGALFGQLLYTADTLADAANYDERDWGMGSLEPALALCLEIAKNLP